MRGGHSGRRNLSGLWRARTGKVAVHLEEAENGTALKCGSFPRCRPRDALRHRQFAEKAATILLVPTPREIKHRRL